MRSNFFFLMVIQTSLDKSFKIKCLISHLRQKYPNVSFYLKLKLHPNGGVTVSTPPNLFFLGVLDNEHFLCCAILRR